MEHIAINGVKFFTKRSGKRGYYLKFAGSMPELFWGDRLDYAVVLLKEWGVLDYLRAREIEYGAYSPVVAKTSLLEVQAMFKSRLRNRWRQC